MIDKKLLSVMYKHAIKTLLLLKLYLTQQQLPLTINASCFIAQRK